jgi:hypothetical protein
MAKKLLILFQIVFVLILIAADVLSIDTNIPSGTNLPHDTSSPRSEELKIIVLDTPGEHGRKVCEIIRSISGLDPELVVVSDDGLIWVSRLEEVLENAIAKSPDIINCSFYTPNDTPRLRQLISEAHDRNIIITAATGNGISSKVYPAGYPEVISVTMDTDNSWARSYIESDCNSFACAKFTGLLAKNYKEETYAFRRTIYQ